jgi:hypothetical protein
MQGDLAYEEAQARRWLLMQFSTRFDPNQSVDI